MHLLDDTGAELNLNGFSVFLCKEPVSTDCEEMKKILNMAYGTTGKKPQVIAGRMRVKSYYIARSIEKFDDDLTYKFPESLIRSYDVLDHARDVKEEHYRRFGIVTMTPDLAMFSSMVGMLAFFNDQEVSASGITRIVEAMGDNRVIPILCQKMKGDGSRNERVGTC